MNMVMGPNGTGKSTLVAALALGLGYAPSVLGRSKDVGEYIRYGTTEAIIELVLKVDREFALESAEATSKKTREEKSDAVKEFVVVRRIIKRHEHGTSSSWSTDGKAVNLASVQALASRLGVQVDNLCQFLPQDRVSDFARMTPIEMLQATQAAAGSAKMLQQHQSLSELCKKAREISNEEMQEEKKLSADRKQLENLQNLQARVQEQNNLMDRLKYLRKKLPFLEYKRARDEALASKKLLKEAQAELNRAIREAGGDELELQLRALEEEAKELKAVQDSADEHGGRLAHDLDAARKCFRDTSAKAEAVHADIIRLRKMRESKRVEYEKLRASVRETDEQIRDQEHVVAELEAQEQSQSPARTESKQELKQVEDELDNVDRDIDDIAREGDILRNSLNATNSHLQSLENESLLRLEKLRKLNPSAYAAYQWLQSNQSKFERPVLGPLGLEVSVRDRRMISIVESVISKQIQVTFLCQSARDQELFMQCMSDGQNLQVNCTCLEDGVKLSTYRSADNSPMSKQLQKLGFDGGWVLDALEGPEPVLAALCEMARIHKIPFSLKNAESIDIEQCQQIPGLVKFATTDLVFELRRSRYNSDEVAVRSTPHKAPFLFAGAENDSRRADLHDKVREIREKQALNQQRSRELLARQQRLKANQQSLKQVIDTRNEQIKKHLSAQTLLKKLKLQIDMHRNKARQLQNDLAKDFDDTDLREAFKKHLLEEVEAFSFVAQASQVINDHCSLVFESTFHLARIDDQIHLLKQRIEAISAETVAKQALVNDAQAAYQRAHKRAQDSKERIESDPHNQEPDLEEKFSSLPEELEELRTAITEASARLNGMGRLETMGKDSLRDLESREAAVREAAVLLRNLQEDRQKIESEMQSIASEWLPAVTEMINRISIAFSIFFTKIQCRGEVRLRIPEGSADDFDAYSLDILVSFRDGEPLQRLSAHRQSGGEKSVSTILFLLSLQEMARSPFRVVDEINQGMDVHNERRIHSIIVDTATNSSNNPNTACSQYFLITPKLLTGLKYHERMQVLCVYNGTGVPRIK